MQQSNCRSIDVVTLMQQSHCHHHCHDVELASPQPTRRLCNNCIIVVSSSSFGERQATDDSPLMQQSNHPHIIVVQSHCRHFDSLSCNNQIVIVLSSRDCDATIKSLSAMTGIKEGKDTDEFLIELNKSLSY